MDDDAKMMLETGAPPNWFPPDKQIDFRGKRRDLLNHMLLDELIPAVEEVIATHGKNFANLNYWKHEYRPATINGIPDTVGHDCAILARYVHAATLGEEKGLPLLLGDQNARRVKKGDAYGNHQAKIAKNSRGKVGDDEKTITKLIGELALAAEYRLETAKELWPRLWAALDRRGLDPKETETADDWKKIAMSYDFKDRRKSITGGQFANVVYTYRNEEKTG